jgi:hypothetical protein
MVHPRHNDKDISDCPAPITGDMCAALYRAGGEAGTISVVRSRRADHRAATECSIEKRAPGAVRCTASGFRSSFCRLDR